MADLLTEVKDRVLYLTLNRPDCLNALNDRMISELLDVFGALFWRHDGFDVSGTARALRGLSSAACSRRVTATRSFGLLSGSRALGSRSRIQMLQMRLSHASPIFC